MSSRGSSTKAHAPVSNSPGIEGRRILLIEDSPVVGPFTVDVLEELGCKVVGPAPNLAAAREMLEGEKFDAAMVDIHIRGERVFPLCEMLAARKTPFVLTSGYAEQVPDKWADRPRLQKPYTIGQVEEALKALLDEKPR